MNLTEHPEDPPSAGHHEENVFPKRSFLENLTLIIVLAIALLVASLLGAAD